MNGITDRRRVYYHGALETYTSVDWGHVASSSDSIILPKFESRRNSTKILAPQRLFSTRGKSHRFSAVSCLRGPV